MSGSAESIKLDAPNIAKYFTTKEALKGTLRNVMVALGATPPIDDAGLEIGKVELLAVGGYNSVWLVSFGSKPDDLEQQDLCYQFVFRTPTDDALIPHQVENEIAFMTYVAKHHPSIPVPKIFAYATGASRKPPFIAMEYIQGKALSTAWKSYDEAQKSSIVREISNIIVDMASITFPGIGNLTLSHTLGPTVEGSRLFKGRDKFHHSDCYDIGPYSSTQAYVLACYAKEIHYYKHAAPEDIDWAWFTKTSKPAFITELQAKRDTIAAASPSLFAEEEPFVLVHGDLNGRNILMHDDGRVRAVIDWEFAGSFPLSEILDGTGIDVLEVESEEDYEENRKWADRMVEVVRETAGARGWDERKVELLVGCGNVELGIARQEMVPRDHDEEEDDEKADEDEDQDEQDDQGLQDEGKRVVEDGREVEDGTAVGGPENGKNVQGAEEGEDVQRAEVGKHTSEVKAEAVKASGFGRRMLSFARKLMGRGA